MLSAHVIITRLLHAQLPECGTFVTVDNFRQACEDVKNDSDVPPSLKIYAESMFNLLCANTSLDAGPSGEEPITATCLLDFYTMRLGMHITEYLDLRTCLSLSLLSKGFDKAFVDIHLGLDSESWIDAYCTFGLESSSRDVLRLHRQGHWTALRRMRKIQHALRCGGRDWTRECIISLRNTVACVYSLANKRKKRGFGADGRRRERINEMYFLDVVKSVPHSLLQMLPRMSTVLPVLSKSFNSAYVDLWKSNTLAFRCINRGVAGPLKLTEEQVGRVLNAKRARSSIYMRILYVNTCLRFFSFHLFLLRGRKTIYSRTFECADPDHPGKTYSFTESQFLPFDRDLDDSRYTNYRQEDKETTSQRHDTPGHFNFVKEFTISMISYMWSSRECPCGHIKFLQDMKHDHLFGVGLANKRCRQKPFSSDDAMSSHLQTRTQLRHNLRPVYDVQVDREWHKGTSGPFSFYYPSQIAHMIFFIARDMHKLSEEFLCRPRIQGVYYENLENRVKNYTAPGRFYLDSDAVVNWDGPNRMPYRYWDPPGNVPRGRNSRWNRPSKRRRC